MYESVFVPENKEYSGEDGKINAEVPKSGVVFHNSSTEHTTVIAFDSKTGRSVEVMLRKDAIPDWVNKYNEGQ